MLLTCTRASQKPWYNLDFRRQLTHMATNWQHSRKRQVTAEMPLCWFGMGQENLLSPYNVPETFYLLHHFTFTKCYEVVIAIPIIQMGKAGGLIYPTQGYRVYKKHGQNLNPGLPNSKSMAFYRAPKPCLPYNGFQRSPWLGSSLGTLPFVMRTYFHLAAMWPWPRYLLCVPFFCLQCGDNDGIYLMKCLWGVQMNEYV